MTEASEIQRLLTGSKLATAPDDEVEIERVLAGAKLATAPDEEVEIERIVAGNPPLAEVARILAGNPPLADDDLELQKTTLALSSVAASSWGPSSLRGSRIIRIGRARFSIPRTAETKTSRRAGTTWVRLQDGQTFILSELGELQQSETERRSTRFDLL